MCGSFLSQMCDDDLKKNTVWILKKKSRDPQSEGQEQGLDPAPPVVRQYPLPALSGCRKLVRGTWNQDHGSTDDIAQLSRSCLDFSPRAGLTVALKSRIDLWDSRSNGNFFSSSSSLFLVHVASPRTLMSSSISSLPLSLPRSTHPI